MVTYLNIDYFYLHSIFLEHFEDNVLHSNTLVFI